MKNDWSYYIAYASKYLSNGIGVNCQTKTRAYKTEKSEWTKRNKKNFVKINNIYVQFIVFSVSFVLYLRQLTNSAY